MKRKNKFGFTLVELLAVLVILAVISLIVFPMIGNVINVSKEKAFLRSVEGLEDAAKLDYQNDNYKGDRMYQYENGNFTLTKVKDTTKNEDIKVEGIIENGIGNVYIYSEGDVEIKIWNDKLGKCAEKSTNDHTAKITETVKELCAIDFVSVPIITLNGDSTMTITQGETFTDPGYTATYKGIDITSSVQVSGSVNTSVVDTYTLTYTVSYNGKDAIPVERIVNVEIACPTVTIMGKSIQTCDTATLDPDGNVRYVGADPDNYVSFNGELWRIIGVFHDDVKGDQIKIIRDQPYNNTTIAWDEDDGSYSNNWATASLNLLWNDETNETSYIRRIQANDPTSYGYIDLDHVWNIGGTLNYNSSTRSDFYTVERSETPAAASGSSATWEGAIGLMYPSDYGYSTSGSSETCNSIIMYDWDTAPAKAECAENSWLLDKNNNQWTFTPVSVITYLVFNMDTIGAVYLIDSVHEDDSVARPVLYLKSDTKIVGGLGTDQQPFILGA